MDDVRLGIGQITARRDRMLCGMMPLVSRTTGNISLSFLSRSHFRKDLGQPGGCMFRGRMNVRCAAGRGLGTTGRR